MEACAVHLWRGIFVVTEFDAVAWNEEVRRRAIDFIIEKWGALGDLPQPLVHVVWVTVYRALEVSNRIGPRGSSALVTDQLRGGTLGQQLKEASLKIRFLERMLPLIRVHSTRAAKLREGQLLIDILQWNIVDAGRMSRFSRAIARLSAKADPAYSSSVPDELYTEIN